MRGFDYDVPVACVGRFVSGTIVGNLSGLRGTVRKLSGLLCMGRSDLRNPRMAPVFRTLAPAAFP